MEAALELLQARHARRHALLFLVPGTPEARWSRLVVAGIGPEGLKDDWEGEQMPLI